MKSNNLLFVLFCALLMTYACKESGSAASAPASNSSGLKIAFVNGDSILTHYKDFKKQSEAMEIKQRNAEEQLQSKGAALEKEIMAYQQKAQTGTLTGKEMQAREKYLSSRQEAILAERDQMAQEIMKETAAINKQLQAVLQEKLNAIKEKEGYDFILSYVEGGPVLVADAKYDITAQVLKQLNEEESATPPVDTTAKK
ncbi:MAG: OmpH family outer membrane protein [Saprospiraceae bacterium]|nr:OmpH family outer membrane protein [Candidatus Opimibacter iunctus]